MIKYYIIYKITNTVDGKFYIGAHITKNVEDSYMGSGKKIKYAIKKHGIENFKKEILYYLSNKEELYKKEYEEVKKYLGNENCYNIISGGNGGYPLNTNKVIVVDGNGKRFKVDKNDPRYLSGDLIPWNRGKSNKLKNTGTHNWSKQVEVNGVTYPSAKVARTELGLTRSAFKYMLKKNKLTH
jgi:hypothetical protein